MLTQTDTNKFASQYQTTTDNVIKEHYQILILVGLFLILSTNLFQ